LQTGDAAALIDLQAIEEIAFTKTAADAEQVPATRELREVVTFIQESRVPAALAEMVDPVIKDAHAVLSHADVAHLHPVDPERDPAAKQAYETEGALFAAEADAS